ncbi:LRR-GTPase of the ROCO family [Ectocarpus siliculosus]|uniref:LRR-GTPase of the ROCO family n=1 Tax=Ectocarpus siliculosus TaxID=2880 RepID=D7FVX5_ECTSI|nr:LRR-GTPase of the ROCO family [Ectocarpus siliculosus]|eukprot:CBJ25495.1 LRR-GTPase of the ROCO family [Ectocarpus siliculosus]
MSSSSVQSAGAMPSPTDARAARGPASATGSAQTDRETLLHFYRTAGGESWTCKDGWAENADDLGSWHGVTTNAEGRVVKLELQGGPEPQPGGFEKGNSIIGAIPPEFGRLGALTTLHLGGNQLTGAIPPELGQLGALEELFLPSNRLSGRIPPELGLLSKLKGLHLKYNHLSGSVPPELGQLSGLELLLLTSNQLSGPIPPELGQLGSLTRLVMSDNKLTGKIPPELGRLSSLRLLYLKNNKLSGEIPRELGQLGALEHLWLSKNDLTGQLPTELGHLGALERLHVMENKLSGTVPPELFRLGALEELDLRNNRFSALGQAEQALQFVARLGQLASGQNLRLQDNPWVMPPEGIVNEGLPAVEKYLRDVREAEEAGAEVKTLNVLKVVLIGSPGAGKTSLLNSIVNERGSRTVGTSEEVSTVGIELRRHHQRNGRIVEFYDCAGQVDYYGMHQTFLTRRALYLLVWDVSRCHGKESNDLDKVVSEDIMKWLYALHLRVPGSAVLLVANKCDGSLQEFVGTAGAVESSARRQLQEWQGNRKSPGVTKLTILQQPSLVSCDDGGGLSEVIARVDAQGATSIVVPPSWGLALAFLDALRDSRDPEPATRRFLHLDFDAEVGAAQGSSFMTESTLFQRWNDTVKSVAGELTSPAERMAVSDHHGAMEGALWISEFAGHILRVAHSDVIFLDVVWLSAALKPILSHKLESHFFPRSELTAMKDELVDNGVLRLKFAEYLWDLEMEAPPSEEVMDALCGVLHSLGVALPLGREERHTASAIDPAAAHGQIGRQDMLVIMRLPDTCEENIQGELQELVRDLSERHGGNEVTLKWRFDGAGASHGLVERVIASCHEVGSVRSGLCWRYGAVFQSYARADDGGLNWLYSFVIRYDEEVGSGERVLAVTMFGPTAEDRLWAALRWVASSVVNTSTGWPGVRWEGGPACAIHARGRMYFKTPIEARIGDPILTDPDPRTAPNVCDCYTTEGNAMRLVLERLGTIIDTQKDDPFGHLHHDEGGSAISQDNRGEEAGGCAAMSASCSRVFHAWRPLAWKTAAGFGTVAATLFGAVDSAVEPEDTAWKVCVGFVTLLLFGAAVSVVLGTHDQLCTNREEEPQSQEGTR